MPAIASWHPRRSCSHLSTFLTSWHAYLQISHSVRDFRCLTSRAEHVLCSTLLLFRCAIAQRIIVEKSCATLQDTKNPRATAACSGSLHKHWPVGVSLLSLRRLLSVLETCEVVRNQCHSEHLFARGARAIPIGIEHYILAARDVSTSTVNTPTTSHE